jgi:hypothetical protein
MSEKFFKELDIEFKGLTILENFIPKANWAWIPDMHVSDNFKTSNTDIQISNIDNFINKVCLKFNAKQALYKFPANSYYKWHKDWSVEFSLNMVLENYDCKTLFEFSKTDKSQLMEIIELKYTPCRWYLFNSQILHTVFNTGNKDRVLYTIPVLKKHNFSYQDFLNWYEGAII